MINKKNLWFLTLFSLVLVLSIYYVSIPSELLVSSNGNIKEEVVSGDKDDTSNVSIEESDMISALKVEDNANTLESINKLKETLTNPTSSIEDKNKAFEELKTINNIASEEETEYLAHLSKEEVHLIYELKNFPILYSKLTKDPKRYLNLINKKLKQ